MEPLILWNNILNNTMTATDTESTDDYAVAYLQDLRPYTTWKAASAGTKYITMDALNPVTVDTIGIMTHNLGTAGATVSVESSTTGAWAGEQVIQLTGFMPSDDKAVIKTFTAATIRYWRIKIVTTLIVPQVGILIAGGRLDFPVYPDTPFTAKTESVNVTAEISKGGHLLGVTSRYTPLSFSASFTWPPMSFIDGDFKTFWEEHGRKVKPFLWVPNYTEWPERVYFVRFPANFSLSTPQSDTTNADRLNLQFEGVAE